MNSTKIFPHDHFMCLCLSGRCPLNVIILYIIILQVQCVCVNRYKMEIPPLARPLQRNQLFSSIQFTLEHEFYSKTFWANNVKRFAYLISPPIAHDVQKCVHNLPSFLL
jgi:hypothetical protein